MSQRSSRAATWVLGLFAVASVIDCGGSGSVSLPSSGPSYGQLGGASPVAWSSVFGGRTGTPSSVAAAPDGTLRIAATLRGDATIGGTRYGGGSGVLVAELAADGQPMWTRAYGDTYEQSASAVAVDAAGDAIVVGTFAGTIDLGDPEPVLEVTTRTPTAHTAPGTAPMRAVGTADTFVAKLDHLGNLVWSTHLGTAGMVTQVRAVALGPGGEIAVTGGIYDGAGTTPVLERDDSAVFVARLDADGNMEWTKSFGGGGPDVGTSLSANAQGELAVTGTYGGAIDLGAGPLPSSGARGVFVARFDPNGTTEWSAGAGGPADDDAVGVAFGPSGAVLALANDSSGGGRVVLTKYGAGGKALWVERYGGGDPFDAATALAVDSQGNAYVAGQFREAFDFGTCTLAPTRGLAAGPAFVAMVDPQGQATCGREYGLAAQAEIVSLAIAAVHGVVMAGDFEGAIDFGQGTLTASPSAGFVAREEPIPQPNL